MPKPSAIGIGAQKCASSWIHAVLAAHPQASVAREKELDFFSYYYDRGYRWYESLFDAASPATLHFENSPSYFHDPRTPERVRAYDPDMKILLLLRDPVERAYSNHLHEVIKGHIPNLPFEEGLANNPSYLDQSRYGTHLARWLDVFPAAQVKVILAESIKADPAAEARRVYEFLGIDPEFTTGLLSERRNESDRARLPWLRSLLRSQGDRMRRMGLEEQLMRVKKLPPVRKLLEANRVDVRQEVPAMHPDTRKRITEELGGEMQRLAGLIGREPVEWPSWARVKA